MEKKYFKNRIPENTQCVNCKRCITLKNDILLVMSNLPKQTIIYVVFEGKNVIAFKENVKIAISLFTRK